MNEIVDGELNHRPLVTVITPTFRNNDAAGFNRMLASVNTQCFSSWEHLIASDGIYEPEVAEWIRVSARELPNDCSRRYLVTSTHYGGFGAGVRQEVMATHARGRYLCFLDDDNFLMPTYLPKLVSAIETGRTSDADCRFAICSILHFGPLPNFHGKTPRILVGLPQIHHIDTLQVLVDADAMKSVGWINPAHFKSDGLTFQELGKRFHYVRAGAVDEVLAVHL